jgi:hypothetical protein
MSVAIESPEDQTRTRCAQCGAPMPADQEWCLECGTARTLIHRAPDWRIAVGLILAAALIVGGVLVAVSGLSDHQNRVAAAAVNQTPARPASTTPDPAPQARATAKPRRVAPPPPNPIASWAVGLGGWTVILGTDSSRAAAAISAHQLLPTAKRVGVLYSSEHRSLTPGLWVVFSGRYPTEPAAVAAAASLQRAGLPTAHAHMVAPPGG